MRLYCNTKWAWITTWHAAVCYMRVALHADVDHQVQLCIIHTRLHSHEGVDSPVVIGSRRVVATDCISAISSCFDMQLSQWGAPGICRHTAACDMTLT